MKYIFTLTIYNVQHNLQRGRTPNLRVEPDLGIWNIFMEVLPPFDKHKNLKTKERALFLTCVNCSFRPSV